MLWILLSCAILLLCGLYVRLALYPSLNAPEGEFRCGKGLRLNRKGEVPIVILKGTPEEIGRQHGLLLKKEIRRMRALLWKCAIVLRFKEKRKLTPEIQDIYRRCSSSVPARFLTELEATGEASGIGLQAARNIGFFPELFHCSGIAARGKATPHGDIVHVRVLDYLRDIGLQKMAAIQLFMPDGHNAWLSVGFAGLNGTVTAMNEHGLAIGEIGGRGEGNWDGLTMSYLLRQVMEECRTVDDAIQLYKRVPHTCEFFYVLSDPTGNIVTIYTQAGQPPLILRPAEKHDIIQEAFDDIAWYTRPSRQEALCQRLHEYYGRIDAETMKAIIQPPVSMTSNLQDVIFLPRTLELQYAYAGANTLACQERYITISLKELLAKYR